ncbi:MAG: response regulator [Methyloligellaceae bacterium]
MSHHTAFGGKMSDLDIVLVDNQRASHQTMRDLLSGLGIKRYRAFADPSDALRELQTEPANLVFVEWQMDRLNGCELIHMMRHKSMKPLSYLPIILVTGQVSATFIDQALIAGAHQVLVKPVSAAMLKRRLDWILSDDRQFVLKNSRYEIENARELVAASRQRQAVEEEIRQIVAQKGEDSDSTAATDGPSTSDEVRLPRATSVVDNKQPVQTPANSTEQEDVWHI